MSSLLSDLLFKAYRRKVLLLLLLHPERQFHVREIARLTDTVAGTLNKELRKLAEAGILQSHKQGSQLLYSANRDCLIFDELFSILQKTSGVKEVLEQALLPLVADIEVAFIFGSIASGKAHNDSDIDLCLIGDVDFRAVIKALYDSQSILQREINPKCFSVLEWQQHCETDSVFIRELIDKPVIDVIGHSDDFRQPVSKKPRDY
ncbi:MAG: nucleotidyltransferase domain-containing protein [Pseudomonadales bacterium]|nr:nucleotidyltransferase domain-containing protein [Pseudomonadales bacterium]